MEKRTKTLNIKISEEVLDKMNYYRKENINGSASQADYVIEAIEEKNKKIRVLRGGGMLLNIPSPDRFLVSEKDKLEILNILGECSEKLRKINPGLSFGINEIFIYARNHFFECTEKQKQEFDKNIYKDLEFENGK